MERIGWGNAILIATLVMMVPGLDPQYYERAMLFFVIEVFAIPLVQAILETRECKRSQR